jgi:hypothetical protein
MLLTHVERIGLGGETTLFAAAAAEEADAEAVVTVLAKVAAIAITQILLEITGSM